MRSESDSPVSSDRRRLAEALSSLIARRMNYRDLYGIDFSSSRDSTVCEVWGEIVSLLYNDLAPNNAVVDVSEETAGILSRCVILLDSGEFYEWPPYPKNSHCGLLTIAGLAASCLIVLWVSGNVSAIRWTVLPFIGAAVLAFFFDQARMRKTVVDWERSGDLVAWPFLSQAQLQAARDRLSTC